MKKLLVVDNSPIERERLVQSLRCDPRFEVVGELSTSRNLLEKLGALRPDLIIFDIDSPRSGGVSAIEQTMSQHPLPIVAISAERGGDTQSYLDAGALSVQPKPSLSGSDFLAQSAELRTTIALMSEVKVVTRRPRRPRPVEIAPVPRIGPRSPGALVIGASTGGPTVLAELLTGLESFPAPIFIAQHISKGFVQGLIDWLNDLSGLTLEIAQGGTRPEPGKVYFAPDDYQFGFGAEPRSGKTVILPRRAKEGEICPSVDHLFFSAASHYGASATGVLLTGMGRDGARGLKALRDAGAMTIAQTEATCSVYGMPFEAVKLKAAKFQLAPNEIRALLDGMAQKRSVS